MSWYMHRYRPCCLVVQGVNRLDVLSIATKHRSTSAVHTVLVHIPSAGIYYLWLDVASSSCTSSFLSVYLACKVNALLLYVCYVYFAHIPTLWNKLSPSLVKVSCNNKTTLVLRGVRTRHTYNSYQTLLPPWVGRLGTRLIAG